MDDRTMPKLPPIPVADAVVEKVTPYCSQCKVAIPDLTVNHHVCIPDGAGGFKVGTRDEAAATWRTAEDQRITARAANPEAEKIVEP